jgi:flagellar rod assembly protein/muramidase FlgJ
MTPTDFIAAVAPGAIVTQLRTGVPAGFTIAQAALESGWGTSGLAQAPANNLFGIKATVDWKGRTVDLPTHEWVCGQMVQCVAHWRAYDSWGDSLLDHAAFLTGNPRYHAAFAHTDDSAEFARAVAAAGYATDPAYADKVIATMRAHNLAQYDRPVTVGDPPTADGTAPVNF